MNHHTQKPIFIMLASILLFGGLSLISAYSDDENITEPGTLEDTYDDTVKHLDFVITEERWQIMLDDMADLFGPFGVGGGMPVVSDEDPVFVPAEVFYDGTEWYRVGLRFKETQACNRPGSEVS